MNTTDPAPYRAPAPAPEPRQPGDTGRNLKVSPEEERTAQRSGARVFDMLAESNLALVGAMGKYMRISIAFVIIVTMLTCFSTITLYLGQQETRELIVAFGKKDCAETLSAGTQKKTTTLKKE